MSAYLPPEENLPIFNPTVFKAGDDTGITLGDADKRYLKKSGGIMTGGLSTPSVTTPLISLNGSNVGDELDKIPPIEEKTTDQSFDDVTNTTSFANNVSVATSLTLNGTDVEDELDKITSIEEKTTDQTFDDVTNTTTFANNLDVDGTLSTPNVSNHDSSIQSLLNVTDDQSYSTGTSTTTFSNNLHVSGVLSTTNVGNHDTTIMAVQRRTTALGYLTGTDTSQFLDVNSATLLEIKPNETKIYKPLTANTGVDIGTNAAKFGTGYFGDIITPSISLNVLDTRVATITTNVADITHDGSNRTTIDNDLTVIGSINNNGATVLGYALTIDGGIKITGSIAPFRQYLFENPSTSLFDGNIFTSNTANIGTSSAPFGDGYFTKLYYIDSVTSTVTNVQNEFTSKQDRVTVVAPIEKSGAEISVAYDTTPSSIGGGTNLITSNGVYQALLSKQDTLTAGEGVDITNDEIQLDFSTITNPVTIPQSVQIEISSSPVFDVLSSGVTAHTAIYRRPQMVFYNFGKTSVSNNLFGNGNRFVGVSSTRATGSQFSSFSNGSVTFSQNGYYKLRVAANPRTDVYNDRVAFMVYLHIAGADYDRDEAYNLFGWSYTRNASDGAHSSISFEDYLYITSGTILQVRHRVDTDDLSWNNTLNNTLMECYCNLQIERIYETNIT
jgi:hypothetical protein